VGGKPGEPKKPLSKEVTVLGAAVVGLNVGRLHALGYWESPYVELRAVCDLVPEKLEWVRQQVPVDTYQDLETMLARDDIHLVSVCTPDYTHREVATQVLRAGKHLLLEKPIALTLDDAQAIMQEAARAGTICSIGYEFRINPVVQTLKALLGEGGLGELQAISMYFWRGPFQYGKSSRWIQRAECSGGLLVEEACHWFDLLRWFGGEVSEIQCYGAGGILPETDFEDVAFANMRFASGAIGQMSHVLAGFGTAFLIWVIGTRASAWGYFKETESPFLGLGWPGEYGRVAVIPGYPRTDADKPRLLEGIRVRTFGIEGKEQENIKDYAKLFAACVAQGRQPPVTLEDGYKSLELSLAARASSLTGGARVRLPLSPDDQARATQGFLTANTVAREKEAIARYAREG
jgi:predicted dehydrogenase